MLSYWCILLLYYTPAFFLWYVQSLRFYNNVFIYMKLWIITFIDYMCICVQYTAYCIVYILFIFKITFDVLIFLYRFILISHLTRTMYPGFDLIKYFFIFDMWTPPTFASNIINLFVCIKLIFVITNVTWLTFMCQFTLLQCNKLLVYMLHLSINHLGNDVIKYLYCFCCSSLY